MIKITSKSLIQVIAIIIVVGALIRSGYSTFGLILVLGAIGFYLLRNLRTFISDLRRFKELGRTAKVRLVTFAGLLYIFVHGIATGGIAYFLLMLLLGIDYLIYDNQPPK